MERIRVRLKRFSHVIFIFAKIGYIFSIIGFCRCVLEVLREIIMGSQEALLKIGDVTIIGTMKTLGPNMADNYGTLAYAAVLCALLIVILRIAMRLFANIRDNYTPFTMQNAKLFKREAIWVIVASVVPAAVGYLVGHISSMILSVPFTKEFGDWFSLIVVVMFFVMSLAFQYGCALQEQADTTL